MRRTLGDRTTRPARALLTSMILLAGLAGLAVAQNPPPPQAGQAPAASIADLAWISGSWSVSTDRAVIEEHWTSPASNAILAVGRTLADGRMVAFEYLRIEARDDGIFYVAQPSGRSPTAFMLTKLEGRRAVFENPEHDFPKRVIYSRTGDDELTAWVDGGEGSSDALTFTYRRIGR